MRLYAVLGSGVMGALFGLALMASAVAAEDGRATLQMCNEGDPGDRIASLAGGMAFGLLTGQGLGGPARQFCPPNSGRLSNGQYRLSVCKFLAGHSELMSQDSYLAIGIALLKSYPCEADKAKP